MVQSAKPSIVLFQSSTSLNSIDASAISAGSLSSAYLSGPLPLPTAIVPYPAADGSTSDYSTYDGSTPTPDMLSSTYAYNVHPMSTIATQNIGQLSNSVSSGSNTQPDQTTAQQTSVDFISQDPEATSSMDNMAMTTTTSSSYVQEATFVDSSASPLNQPVTDKNVTSSPFVSTPEASSTIATPSGATVTQSPEQAASTPDIALAPTTSSLDAQSTSTTPDTSSYPELDQGQATSTSVVDTNNNSGSSTTGEDTSVASITSSTVQENISATLGLSLGAILPSDSILSIASGIEASIAPSEPTSLVPQSTLAGLDTISVAATYSIVSSPLTAFDSTSIDPVLVSASADGVVNPAPTSVASPDLVASTSGMLVDLSDSEAFTTSTPIPVISLSDQLSAGEASTSQETLSSSVPVLGPVLNLLSSETSSVILPSETSIDPVLTGSVGGSEESFMNSDTPSATTDIVTPSTTEMFSFDRPTTPDAGSISNDIVASTKLELSDLPSQTSYPGAAVSSSYDISAGAIPTLATEIESSLTDLPFDSETVASDTGIALPAAGTQAALPTTSLGSLDPSLSNIISDAQTVDVAQPSQTAVESFILSGEDQASASLSAEISVVATGSIPDTEFQSSIIPDSVVPSADVQQTEAVASDSSLDITTAVPDLDTGGNETSVLTPTSINVNQQIPDITTSAGELATASPGSSVDNLLASLTSLESQDLPTSTSLDDVSGVAGFAATSIVDNTGDVASAVVSDLPAAASSTVNNFTYPSAAASSIVSKALPSDFFQPTELVSSIINGVSTDLPLATDLPVAASSVIDDGSVPTFASDAGLAVSSIVDNTGDLVSSITSSVDPTATDVVSVVSDAEAAGTSVVDSVGDAASYMVSLIEPVVTENVPSVISDAGAAATSVINTGDPTSSIVSSLDPVVPDVITSVLSAGGDLSITASIDEGLVTSAGVEPTQITGSLASITSVSGISDLTTIVPTTLIDDTLASWIATVDVAESESTLAPTQTDLSVPGLISGALNPGSDLPQQTNEIGSIPSNSVDPSDPATPEIPSSIVSVLSMATFDLASSATSDIPVILSSEAITSTDILSNVESTAQPTDLDVSATAPVIAEPTYSQIDSITTGLDAAATSAALDSDIPTDLFGIEPTASASVPSASDLVSFGDDTVTDLPISPSSTTLEATNVVDPSVTAELSSSIESGVPQSVQSNPDAASDVLFSASSMVETLLTSVVDSVPSSTDFGSEASIIESGAIPTQSIIIPSEALESSTTIADGDSFISSLVNGLATTTDASDLLSTPVISSVLDESTSTDFASITPISLDVAPTSTMLEVLSSELAPISSTLGEVLGSATSVDPSLVAVQSSTYLPTQTIDIPPSDLVSANIPTDPSQVEEPIPSSTSMGITSIPEIPDESFPTVVPESSELMLTAIGATSTFSEATATLAGDSSLYTDPLNSTQLSPTEITAPTTSVLVDLGVDPDPQGAISTSDIPSLSVIDSVESIPTSAADLAQLPTTSLPDILSGLPTEIETMGLSATAALTDPSIVLTESIQSTSATLSDIESSLTEAIDSMTSTLDASVIIPTASSDMLVSTFALGAAQSETLVPLPTEASDDPSQSIEPTSIGSIETDATAPSIVTSNEIISSLVTTEAPSLSTLAIDDLLKSNTDMAGVTSSLDAASPSTSIESSDPESVISTSELVDVLSTTIPLVGSDVPSPSAIATDALSSLVETATSQIEAISSVLDYNSITISSEILASATGTALVDSSSIETSKPDVVDGSTILLLSESQSLPTPTLDFGVPVSGLPTDIVTFTDPTDAVSSLLSSSIIDDESSVPTSILAQPTDILDIPISIDGQSEASAPFTMDINATSDSITVLPLVTDAPTSTSSNPLASITTAPGSPETSYLDTASIVPDAYSTIASMADSSSIDLGSLPTSEILDSAGSLSATSVLQDASSAIAYVDSSTTDLGSLPTNDVTGVAGSSSTTLIVPDVSSAITNSSIFDIRPLPTNDVADVTSLLSITMSSDAWSDIPVSASTNIEATLNTASTPLSINDIPSSTTSDSLGLITPAPDLPETSFLDTSSVVDDVSSAMPSLVGSSAIESESQLTSAVMETLDSSSSITSFDALSKVPASLTASTEEIQDATTISSSTIDLSSITSSDILPLATETSEVGEISSLDTASAILNASSLAQTVVGSSTVNSEPELTSAFGETTDLPSDILSLDSESSVPTGILAQTTDTPSITSDSDIQSQTPSLINMASDPIADASLVSSTTSVISSLVSQVTPLMTDLPSSIISDLSALTTAAPEPLETGSDLLDISASNQGSSSMFSIPSSSAIVISYPAPTRAISEATDVPTITLDSQSETSTLPITSSEGITDISTFNSATDVPLSMVSTSVADSVSSLIDTISASIVLGAANASSLLINSDMATSTSIVMQATGLSDVLTSSATQSDIFTSFDPTTETALIIDATALPSSLTSSLNSEILSSLTTPLVSIEATATSVEIGGASTDISSLSQDDASMNASTPSETEYSASAATDLPVNALSSSLESGIGASTSITAAVSEDTPLSSSISLSTISAESELLSLVTTVQPTDVSVSIGLGYASSSKLPAISQLTSSEEATSTIISGLPTEIQTMGLSDAAAITSSVVSIPSTLSQSLGADLAEMSSSLMSVVDNTTSTSAVVQISADSGLSTPTSPPTLSSIIAPLETSMSVGEASSSAVTLSPVNVPTEAPVAVANMTFLSSASELEPAVASSAVVTSQTLLDTTLASVDSTFALYSIFRKRGNDGFKSVFRYSPVCPDVIRGSFFECLGDPFDRRSNSGYRLSKCISCGVDFQYHPDLLRKIITKRRPDVKYPSSGVF
ncbi:hypothetical protein KCU95_g2178, partial [Aureobasidium melanogenum]